MSGATWRVPGGLLPWEGTEIPRAPQPTAARARPQGHAPQLVTGGVRRGHPRRHHNGNVVGIVRWLLTQGRECSPARHVGEGGASPRAVADGNWMMAELRGTSPEGPA